ncbi:MAG: hypothetical protein QF828_04265, partial [Pseudomonadales bacterium]|nr:hypothetical protein [Pseudomonadales bacterium]
MTYALGDNSPAYGSVSFDNGNITYTSTTVAGNDNFNVKVTDGNGGEVNIEAGVGIELGDIEISQEPQPQRVNAGQSAVFTVRASVPSALVSLGDTLTYRWKDKSGSYVTATPSSDWITFPFGYANAASEMKVTVAAKADGSGNQFKIGSATGESAVASATLYMTRGQTYKFTYSGFTSSEHPLYLATTGSSAWAAGANNDQYTSGVTSQSGSFEFAVPSNAPDTLYYHCGLHGGMGGTIEIYDSGAINIIQNVQAENNWSVEVASQAAPNLKREWNSWFEANLTLNTTGATFGRITGYSKDSAGGIVMGHFEVIDEFENWVDLWQFGGVSFNETAGTYVLDIPAGKYKIQVWPNDPLYSQTFYDAKTDFGSADLITVVEGEVASGINFDFVKQDVGVVTGTITDATTGSALSEAELHAFKLDSSGSPINNWPDYHFWMGGDQLDSNGAYSVNVPVGSYIFRVKVWSAMTDSGESIAYDTVYYDAKTKKSEASTVAVAKDATTSNVNFSMTRARFATITGTVTDENDSTLQGWAHMDLFTYPTEGKITHENMWDYYAEVIEMFYDQSSGQYTVKVAAGDYILGVGGDSNGTNYRNQFYDGVYDPKKATKITLAEDETKTINFKLYPELRIEPDYASDNALKISGTISYESTDDSSSDDEQRAITKMDGSGSTISAQIYTLSSDVMVAGKTLYALKYQSDKLASYAVVVDPVNPTKVGVFEVEDGGDGLWYAIGDVLSSEID